MQIEKDRRLRETKDTERSRKQQDERTAVSHIDKKRDDLKREEDARHKMELDNVKQKYTMKMHIEKEKIQEENNKLLEESGDIDYQVRLFKQDLMES